MILEHNATVQGYEIALNRFCDWHEDEFKKMMINEDYVADFNAKRDEEGDFDGYRDLNSSG